MDVTNKLTSGRGRTTFVLPVFLSDNPPVKVTTRADDDVSSYLQHAHTPPPRCFQVRKLAHRGSSDG